ncbi:MAG: hypothetical protein ACREJG_01480 [Candidatus Rokuibacteriota bacterium]
MTRTTGLVTILLTLLAAVAPALAHITPPVVLVSERDAVLGLLGGSRRFFVREVRLSPAERDTIQTEWRWRPDEDFHRFYLGRDEQGRLLGAAIFVTEVTIHGPVRVAVGIAPDGTLRGAAVVELTEETYPWVKPLIDGDLVRDYVGRDSRGAFGLPGRTTAGLNTMSQFYGEVVTSLLQRALILYDVGVQRRGGAA